MNRLVKICIIFMAIFLLSTAVHAKEGGKKEKIGYVDFYKVFSGYEKTRQSESSLEKEFQKKQDERNKLTSEAKKLQEEMELLSESEKEKKKLEAFQLHSI